MCNTGTSSSRFNHIILLWLLLTDVIINQFLKPKFFSEAHRALELLEDYHSKLIKPQDRQLRLAIERVIRIFKSRLFQALLGKSLLVLNRKTLRILLILNICLENKF